MHKIKRACLISFWAFLSLPAFAHHIHIEQAVVMQPLPGKTKSTAYFSVVNQSSNDIRLIKVASDFAVIEMHETVSKGGRSVMVRHDSTLVAAGQRVRYERGGKHLMLFKMAPLTTTTVELTFHFDDGSEFVHPFHVKQW